MRGTCEIEKKRKLRKRRETILTFLVILSRFHNCLLTALFRTKLYALSVNKQIHWCGVDNHDELSTKVVSIVKANIRFLQAMISLSRFRIFIFVLTPKPLLRAAEKYPRSYMIASTRYSKIGHVQISQAISYNVYDFRKPCWSRRWHASTSAHQQSFDIYLSPFYPLGFSRWYVVLSLLPVFLKFGQVWLKFGIVYSSALWW